MDIIGLLKMAKEELGPRWRIFILVLLVLALVGGGVSLMRETGDNLRAMWAWFAPQLPSRGIPNSTPVAQTPSSHPRADPPTSGDTITITNSQCFAVKGSHDSFKCNFGATPWSILNNQIAIFRRTARARGDVYGIQVRIDNDSGQAYGEQLERMINDTPGFRAIDFGMSRSQLITYGIELDYDKSNPAPGTLRLIKGLCAAGLFFTTSQFATGTDFVRILVGKPPNGGQIISLPRECG